MRHWGFVTALVVLTAGATSANAAGIVIIHKLRAAFTSPPTGVHSSVNTAATSAGEFTVPVDISGDNCIQLDEDFDTQVNLPASSSAGAGCGLADGAGATVAVNGGALAFQPIGSAGLLVEQSTSTDYGFCADSHDQCLIVGSWGAASGQAALTNVTAPIQYLSEMVVGTFGARDASDGMGESSKPQRLSILVEYPGGQTSFSGYVSGDGATLEDRSPSSTNGGVITFEVASGTVLQSSGVFRLSHAVIKDDAYDMNEDGAFDSHDVQWVIDNYRAINISTENPYSVKGNFVVTYPATTPSEAIDSDDASYLNNILDRLGPSFVFGDFNRDGVVDCHDAWSSTPYFGVSIGDPDYRYELDADRDGTVDNSDKIAFFALVNHCDFNQDEIVDDADGAIFAAAYSLLDCEEPAMPAYCPADLNCDDLVDDADFAIFVIRYSNLAC